MFARIADGVVIEWPIVSLAARFPGTSFPSPLPESDLPTGYVMVHAAAPPQAGGNQKVVPAVPRIKDGKWVQGWDVVDLSADEMAERFTAKAREIRAQRDRLLQEQIDTINAVRWSAMTPAQREAAAAKREALLNVPQQAGFPWSVVWPV